MTIRIAAGLILAAALASPALALDLAIPPTTGLGVPCPSHGTGFVRIPGSATCIRLSGRASAGLDLRGTGPVATPRAAGRMAIDTRIDTDLGPVRTFVRVGDGRR